MLVPGRGAGNAISGERIQRLPQAAFSVEARVRHWNAVHYQCVAAETLDLEPQPLEVVAVRFKSISFGRTEVQSQREKESLRRSTPGLERLHEFLVKHTLVGRVLIYQDETVGMLECDVCPPELKQWRNLLMRSRRVLIFIILVW